MTTAILILCVLILVVLVANVVLRTQAERRRTEVFRADAVAVADLVKILENVRLTLHDTRDVLAAAKGWVSLAEAVGNKAGSAADRVVEATKKIETVAKVADTKLG